MVTGPSPASVPDYSAEYTGAKLTVFTAIFVPIQIFCVALRYLARYLVKGPWGLDDIVVLTSLVLQLAMAGLAIGSVKNAGVGYHMTYLIRTDPMKATIWGKYLVAISTLYFGSVNIPKLAILALYRRLFPKKNIRIVIHVLMGVLFALTVSTIVTVSVACRPYAANWHSAMPGDVCINREAFFIWGSIPNIVTDIVMLIVPIPVVWNLHTTTRLKIGLTATFAIGSFGLITSVIRFTTFFKNFKNSFTDGTWSAVDLVIWTQVETGAYLISACVMTYRPLLERIGHGRFVGRLRAIKRSNEYTPQNTGEHNASMPLENRPVIHDRGIKSQGFHRLEDITAVDPRIVVTTNISVDGDIERES